MYWLVALMSAAILGLIVAGIALEMHPALSHRIKPWYKPAMGTQLLTFVASPARTLDPRYQRRLRQRRGNRRRDGEHH